MSQIPSPIDRPIVYKGQSHTGGSAQSKFVIRKSISKGIQITEAPSTHLVSPLEPDLSKSFKQQADPKLEGIDQLDIEIRDINNHKQKKIESSEHIIKQ